MTTSDIQARVNDINTRASVHLANHTRLIGAINQAVALILLLAAFLVFEGPRLDEQLHQQDLTNQEITHHG